jgi:exosortase
MTPRIYSFLLYIALSVVVFRGAAIELTTLSWNDNRYSHIVFIPIISLGLLILKRRQVFREVRYDYRLASVLVASAALAYGVPRMWPQHLGQHGSLAVTSAAIVCSWAAGFAFFYGTRCVKAALFPLGLLLLMVPIAPPVVEVAEVALQKGSAEATHLIFIATSTPVFREGLIFALPGLTIEVAEECSGIRSAISLLITALVLGYLLLRTGWARVCCALLTIPIAIFKNAVRIATLSLLGAYVSPDYIHGPLHHRGGPLFSVLSLILLIAGVWLLRKGEDHTTGKGDPGAPGPGVLINEGQQTPVRPVG